MSKPVKPIKKVLVTLAVVAIAVLVLGLLMMKNITRPWTRDGVVRAQILQIAPRVGGPIVELHIQDNQYVKEGDLLFKIDPRTYIASLESAKASLVQAEFNAAEALVEANRARSIYNRDKGAIAELTVIQKESVSEVASAAADLARAQLETAQLNLDFTNVKAPVDGYITNMKLQIGGQMVPNNPVLALVDIGSFWVHGYFKETQIKRVSDGDTAVIKLMSYGRQPLEGVVDSIGWGIAQSTGNPGVDLLPSVNPSFDWIRLAQRIPVRITLTDVPEDIVLRAGTTASVTVFTRRK